MKVFFAAAEDELNLFDQRVSEVFSDNARKLGEGMWMIAIDSTTKDIYRQLDLEGGDFDSFIVLSVTDYFGWADKSVWEWVEMKERDDD